MLSLYIEKNLAFNMFTVIRALKSYGPIVIHFLSMFKGEATYILTAYTNALFIGNDTLYWHEEISDLGGKVSSSINWELS